MSDLKHLYVYPDGTDLEIQTLMKHFNWLADGTSTFDIVDVAAHARAAHQGFDPLVVLYGYDDHDDREPLAPVRLLDRPRRGDDESPRLVLEAQDDCADEWRELTTCIEGLSLVVDTAPVDGRGPKARYRYWAGKRQLLRYDELAA